MSKKPISIKDKPSKKVLLDELESIKHLLDDEDSDFDPPLLTQEVTTKPDHNKTDIDDDFPVLTDSLDEDNIPTLQENFESEEATETNHGMETTGNNDRDEYDDDRNDEDDIVMRAIKAQSRLNSQPPVLTNQETAPPRSLFDDGASNEELSPEMLALNAKPAAKLKPIESKVKDSPKPVEAKKAMPTKPEPKKFLSLEEELSELTNNIVDETSIDPTLDDAETNEVLEEFDDYLEEDYLSDGETSEKNPSIDEEQFDETVGLDDLSDDSTVDDGILDDSALNDSALEDDIELEAFTDFEEKDSVGDNSDDSLLTAAIQEVTDSISDGKLSEHIQESLIKEDSDTQLPSLPTAPKEHQPSLFDAIPDTGNEEPESSEPTAVASEQTEKTSAKSIKPSEPASSTASAATKAKAAKSSSPTANKSKTENPFLPKHIRDRLHTNRTLQQEIDDSSTHSFSPTSSSTGEQAATTSTSASIAVYTPKTPIKEPSNSKMTAEEERVVEEVMGSVLPRIESELRQKIRELIKQEKSTE